MWHSTNPVQRMIKRNGLSMFVTCFYFRFITASYDRTCKVWDTASGEELHTLEGHKNVVYAIAFNNPFGYVERFSLQTAEDTLFF